MKTVLKCLGAIVYSSISGYVLWLLLYFITPFVMGFGWFMLILYIFLAGGLISGLISSLGMILLVPTKYLFQDCVTAKMINALCMFGYGFSAARLPWGLDIEYGVLQYILAVSLTVTFIIAYISLAFYPFSSNKN